MDASLPPPELARIERVLASYREQGLKFHALRTRQAGTRAFVTLHVLVPGAWTVQQAHDWSERIEADLREAVPGAHVTTHLEPDEDPVSHLDQDLDRPRPEWWANRVPLRHFVSPAHRDAAQEAPLSVSASATSSAISRVAISGSPGCALAASLIMVAQ
jgi:hypothetical protein